MQDLAFCSFKLQQVSVSPLFFPHDIGILPVIRGDGLWGSKTLWTLLFYRGILHRFCKYFHEGDCMISGRQELHVYYWISQNDNVFEVPLSKNHLWGVCVKRFYVCFEISKDIYFPPYFLQNLNWMVKNGSHVDKKFQYYFILPYAGICYRRYIPDYYWGNLD